MCFAYRRPWLLSLAIQMSYRTCWTPTDLAANFIAAQAAALGVRDVFISTNGNESDIRILTDALLQKHSRKQQEDRGFLHETSPSPDGAQVSLEIKQENHEGGNSERLELSVDQPTIKTLVIGVNRYAEDNKDFLQALALEVSDATVGYCSLLRSDT